MQRRINASPDAWIERLRDTARSVSPPPELKRKIMTQLELKNDQDKMLALVRIDSLQEGDPVDAVIRQLQPGMGKAIYIAALGERSVSQQTNYAATPWTQGLEALAKRAVPWRLAFPSGCKLLEIHTYTGFDNLTDREIDEMMAESERSGDAIVVRDLRPNDTLTGIAIRYWLPGEEEGFDFRVFGTTKSRVHVPDMEMQTIERLTIRGCEAVYTADQVKQQLIWAEEDADSGRALQYELLADAGSRDRLIAIAERIAPLDQNIDATTR